MLINDRLFLATVLVELFEIFTVWERERKNSIIVGAGPEHLVDHNMKQATFSKLSYDCVVSGGFATFR